MFSYGKTEAVFDGQQALDELERRQYDLVLLDLQMPVLDGYSAHQKTLELYGPPSAGGPCVVALSANADQVCIMHLRHGMSIDPAGDPADLPRARLLLLYIKTDRYPSPREYTTKGIRISSGASRR